MNSLLLDFSQTQLILTGLLFIWAGFVRSGLGFGGAALGLPLMLFIYDQPIFWLPVIGLHLLFFSALTLDGDNDIRKKITGFGKENQLGSCLGSCLSFIYSYTSAPKHQILGKTRHAQYK